MCSIYGDKKAIINDCTDEISQFINDVKPTKNRQIIDISDDEEINQLQEKIIANYSTN